MKKKQLIQISLLLGIFTGVSFMNGCASTETIVTREISEEGTNTVKNTVIKESRRPYRRSTIEKEVVTENVRCVGKNGKNIPAETPEECIAKGGKVVDEVTVEQEKIRGR